MQSVVGVTSLRHSLLSLVSGSISERLKTNLYTIVCDFQNNLKVRVELNCRIPLNVSPFNMKAWS